MGVCLQLIFEGFSDQERSLLSHFRRPHGHVRVHDIAALLAEAGLRAVQPGPVEEYEIRNLCWRSLGAVPDSYPTAHGDFVHGAIPLTCMAHDLRNLLCIERASACDRSAAAGICVARNYRAQEREATTDASGRWTYRQ